MARHRFRWPLALTLIGAWAGAASAQGVHVWTYHNDNARTGQNLGESKLTRDRVKNELGLRRILDVDGDVYAQPLHLSGVPIADGAGVVTIRDVVYVATQNDSVYAFDAKSGQQLKCKSLLAEPGASAIPVANGSPFGNADIVPKVGIVGTPVIAVDPAHVEKSTLYVVAKYQVGAGSNPTFVQRMNALDVTTLEHRPMSPSAPISASVPGTGDGGTVVPFSAFRANQRAGLLLLDGVVYACWASHGDQGFYHGWVIGFDAITLQQVAVFNSSPNGVQAGIWHAGAAPAADSRGFIYLSTGNGTFDGQWDHLTGVPVPGTLDANGFPAHGNYGDSILKLALDRPNRRLVVADYFTPYKQAFLSANDLDQGAGGLVLLPEVPHPTRPGTTLRRMVTAAKDGVIYLLDCDNLGKFTAPNNPNPAVAPDLVLQRIPSKPTDPSPVGLKYGVAAYFDGGIYLLGSPLARFQNQPPPAVQDVVKRFALANTGINPTPSKGTLRFQSYTNSPSISANVSADAIVWIVEAPGYQPNLATNPDTGLPNPPAVLHAFDASNLADEIYNSNTAHGGMDQPRQGIKFTVPTIANGRVFFGVRGGVAVYGLPD